MKIIFSLLLLISVTSFAQTPNILIKQNDVIWGFDFLTDGRILYTLRGGKMFVYNPKTKTNLEVKGVPAVHAVGQGGLLDLRVHPKNGYIYFTYAAPVTKTTSTTALARAKFDGEKLLELKEIFSAKPASENDYHYGSRIEFDNGGHVFITVGERGERPLVQKDDNTLGKVIRMNEDGSQARVYAKGIRSPQGLTLRPGTSELWEAEMGPQGGDELNIIKEDANYGWPVVTFGREYDGPKIGEGTSKKGMEQPIVYWVPSISPSALTFWKGDLYLATLSGQHLRKLTLKGHTVVNQKEYFKDLGWRFRNVRPGPDGLYFSTDEGKLGVLTLLP